MIFHTFLLIFLAEMADKTQLMVMALTNKYKTRTVIVGMCIGIIIISALSVLAGELIANWIPMVLVKVCAALMFLIFGLTNLMPQKAEESSKHFSIRLPIISIALTFLIAELGDKTQLTTVALAANHISDHSSIFLGASCGLILANLVGIIAGKLIFSHLSEDTVKIISSFIFFLFGSLNLFEILIPSIWLICIYSITLIVIAYLTYEKSRA